MADEPLEIVARKLGTTVDTLREFEDYGWIYTVRRNGRCLLPEQMSHRTRLIVHLKTAKRWNPRQIAEILISRPIPQSDEELIQILASIGP